MNTNGGSSASIQEILSRDAENIRALPADDQLSRERLLCEIMDTERHYVGLLQQLVEVYIIPFNPIKNGGKDVLRLFKGITELSELHQNILDAIPRASIHNASPVFETASVFTMAIPALTQFYVDYCRTFVSNMSLLCKLRNKFVFCDYISEKRDLCSHDIAWLLRLPIQRVPQYYYLFQSLEKVTTEQTLESIAVGTLMNQWKELTFIMEEAVLESERIEQSFEDGSFVLENTQKNSAQIYEGWNVLILGDDVKRSKTKLQNRMVQETIPTVTANGIPSFENVIISAVLEPPFSRSTSTEVLLRLWDLTGFESFAGLRSLHYPLVDAFLLCFSIDSRAQFSDLITWVGERKKYMTDVPFLLVGLGSELRSQEEQNENLVTCKEAQHFARVLKVPYFECSTNTGQNIRELILETASCVIHPKRFSEIHTADVNGEQYDATEKIFDSILNTHVDLSCLGLDNEEILNELHYCKHLTSLDLSGNLFEQFPMILTKFQNISKLDLSHNHITTVNGIEKMKYLTELNLEGNKLNFLPAGLGYCTTLMRLNMKLNPLVMLPTDIFAKKEFDNHTTLHDSNQLFAYLRSIQEGGQAPHYRAKVMFVGDGEVGKTSMLQSFQELQSLPAGKKGNRVSKLFTELPVPKITDGIDISEVVWYDQEKERKISWDCWDYAGQEIYYTTHQFFLSTGAVYLICFNLLNRDFSRIEYWLNSVHTRARGSPIILVGTHSDSAECTPSYIEDYRRELKIRYMRRFKSTLGLPSIKDIFMLSTQLTKPNSAKSLRSLMDRIGLIMSKEKLVGQMYPRSWLGLEQHLRVLQKANQDAPSQSRFMEWDQFRATAKNCHISSDDVPEVAAFLHSSGVICHFNDEHSGLANLVILDPQFLTEVMSAVISLRSGFVKCGEIMESDLVHVWKGFNPSLHATLMGLLERFEIAFSLPSDTAKGKYLIPALLPTSQPDSYSSFWSPLSDPTSYQLGRIYTFKFLPLGFFSRLFVRVLHLPTVQPLCYWNNGVIIDYEQEIALIRYNPTQYQLTMTVRGTKGSHSRGQLLRLLIESVETVIEGWYETDVEITVPCSHCTEAGSYSPFIFSQEQCIKKVTSGEGKPFVLCRGVRKVRIDELAPDISFNDMITKRIDFKELLCLSEIGVGAFGKVYKGIYRETVIAVKVLENQKKDQFSEYEEDDDAEFKRFNEFQREVWIMSCIRHEKLVRLEGISTNPPSMIMELLSMGDLYHTLYPKNVPCDDLDAIANWNQMQSFHQTLCASLELRIHIALDIAKGMEYLHSLAPPIIHRDLRSPNIFLTSLNPEHKTVAKVGDFGLSRLVASTLSGGDFNLNWLAPEVMKGEQYTEKMDIYSFAIICNELISLEKPFEEYDEVYAGKPRGVFKNAVIDGLRPTIPSHCYPPLKTLIEEMWQPQPGDRPSFSSIVKKLLVISEELGFDIPTDLEEEDVTKAVQRKLSENPRLLKRGSDSTVTEEQAVLQLDSLLEPKHNHTVQTLLKTETEVWAGCRDGFITIWTKEGQMKQQIKAHSQGGVYSLQLVNNMVIAGSDAGYINGFDITKENKPYKIYKPSTKKAAGFRCLLALREFSDLDPTSKHVRFLSGDTSGNVTIWKLAKKFSSKKTTHTSIATFEHPVNCFIQQGNMIWIGVQGNIHVIDLTGKQMASWNAHKGTVNSFTSFGSFIWSAGNDGHIGIWDHRRIQEYQNGLSPHKMMGSHTSRVFSLETVGKYIVSGSFDQSIILYDAATMEILQEEKRHKDGVRALLTLNDHVFWSGSMQRDARIGIWKLLPQTTE